MFSIYTINNNFRNIIINIKSLNTVCNYLESENIECYYVNIPKSGFYFEGKLQLYGSRYKYNVHGVNTYM